MLNPGGKVWVANFVRGISGAAYLEAVMDWWLIYRSREELLALGDNIDSSRIASRRVFVEPENNVAILELVRT